MTTATLAALPTSILARIWAEISAFLEEAHAANVRTGAVEPFGL